MPRTRIPHALLAVALVAACNDATSNSSSASLDGVWDWTGRLVSTASSQVCSDTGSFVFSQTDTTFSGTSEYVGTCFTAQDSANSHTHELDSIRAGFLHGTAVTFDLYTSSGGLLLCTDTAVLATGAGTLSGIASCGVATLTWEAARGAPLQSIDVSPDSATTVIGGTIAFSAELHASTGARVFGRSLTWTSSSSAIATVASGTLGAIATAVGAGRDTITASAESHSGIAVVTVPAPQPLGSVSAGDARTCALNSAGSAFCWGLGFPTGTSSVPAASGGALQFTSVAVGGEFACGLVSNGQAYCWGANESGELGDNSTEASTTPQLIQTGVNFAALTAGYRYACALTATGAAYCWGDNSKGQLGTGDQVSHDTPQAVAGGVTFAAISARVGHTCGVAPGGNLYCWGDNSFGQLGDNTTTAHLIPNRLSNLISWASVSVGATSTCAITTQNVAYCWGGNGAGQLGIGNTSDQHQPFTVAGGHGFSTISVGDDHTCGLDTTGSAWCWGADAWGQLGNGGTTTSTVPVAVTGGLTFATLSTGIYLYSDEGHSSHSCGVTTGGITFCWGDNLVGQLGVGTHAQSAVPLKVAGQP